MYAIVKNPDETFYTSTVFCHYYKLDKYGYYSDTFSEYYIVLNQEKTKLIKVMNQPKELRYLMPQILELDTDKTDWIETKGDFYLGVVDFLSGIDFDSDDWGVPQELTERCIEIDSRRKYVEFADIKTETDIFFELFCYALIGFHLFYQPKEHSSCLFINLSKISPKCILCQHNCELYFLVVKHIILA